MIYALCILCPPLALLLRGRFFHALLNVPMCLLFWLPGIVHAWAVIARDERDWRDERLACLLRGVPPPVRPGALPDWFSGLAVAVTLLLAGTMVYTAVSTSRVKPIQSVSLSLPTKNADSIGVSGAKPIESVLPQAGQTYAEILAAFGEPTVRNAETGWAFWQGWKGRFEAGRLVAVEGQP
jgi:uncharacterized membrane protein YqaE (UPF0057 family)